MIKAQANNLTSLVNDYVQKEPRRMLKSKQFVNLSCGKDFTVGLTRSGDLLGWGNLSQLGVKSKQVLVPTAICLEQKFVSVSAGSSHCAAIDACGLVFTWGVGSSGKTGGWFSSELAGGHLGHGNTDSVPTPKLVEAFKAYGAKAAKIACGEKHTLILTTDGEVLSCGTGENGLLGTGDSGQVLLPASLQSLADHDIVDIAAGTSHSLALTRDGLLFSWGRNNLGQLGHGDSFVDIHSVEEFPRLIDAESVAGKTLVSIAAAKGRSAAVSKNGELFLWGNKVHHEPLLIDPTYFGNKKVVSVSCGGTTRQHAISVITEDGSLWTLGDSASEMLGRKNVEGWGKNPTPEMVPVLKGKQVLNVYMGFGQHALAIVVEPESVTST